DPVPVRVHRARDRPGGRERPAGGRRGREDPRGRPLPRPAHAPAPGGADAARGPAQGAGPVRGPARERALADRDDDPPRRRPGPRGPGRLRGGGARHRRPAGPQPRHRRRLAGPRRPGVGLADGDARRGGLRDRHGPGRPAGDPGGRALPGLPDDVRRPRRGRHRGAAARARRVGLGLSEVHPPRGGLGDGRGPGPRAEGRGRDGRRRADRPDEHGLHAAARVGRGGRAAGTAAGCDVDRRGRGARRGGHEPARRPQRVRGLQAAPGAGPDQAGADHRGGGEL
ncbi:MAG: Aerobic carbon monoxide dehydrogenase (quinone), medium chain, partial [uncultured Solirubrobacteraceae bacterium]